MAYGPMVDLAMTPEEQADNGMLPALADGHNGPMYPYGTRICLTDAEMEKLGLPDTVNDGDVIDLRAFGEVTSVSKNRRADGTRCMRVEITLQRMAIENESTEDEAEDDD